MQRPAAKETDEKCPICGKMMLKKRSRFGEYLVCSDPECKGKINLTSSGEKVQPEKTDEVCDKCGAPMVIRTGRRGKFLACSAYPKCKNTYSLDAEGHKVASGPIVRKMRQADGFTHFQTRGIFRLLRLPKMQNHCNGNSRGNRAD